MKLLIDGNIILDVLLKRNPHYQESSLVWKMCETRFSQGCVSALTFANLVYVMRKQLDSKRINKLYKELSLLFSFEELNNSDLHNAAELQWDDFEDAIQSVTAKRINADYIITRNTKDYTSSPVPALSPSELLEKTVL